MLLGCIVVYKNQTLRREERGGRSILSMMGRDELYLLDLPNQ